MDITTVAGLALAIAGILLGQALEGGHVASLVQATAAMIVFGGTFGAVMVSFPKKDFIRGMKRLRLAFTEPKVDLAGVTSQARAEYRILPGGEAIHELL